MSELTLLILRIGFLVLMWFFVFAVVYSLRADLFGVKVRKLPVEQVPAAASAPTARPAKPVTAGPAAVGAATKLVITSGPKAGLELPLGDEPMTIGRSSECGLVIRDDYTSSLHARLFPRAGIWTIQDLDSTNGTFHGGDRVTGGTSISLGTPVKVGATTFELRA